MKAEGFEALQASELCFRLLTHPSFNLMQRLKAGQSRAAKHPNTLLSPSDSHRRRHPVFKSVRRASLICFHSTFFLPLSRAARPPAYFIQLSRPLDVDLLPVKGAAFSWSPYVELSCIYLIAICPSPRAPTINSLSVSLLILMKCQHNWRLGNPPPHSPHQLSTIDKAPLTDACGLLVSTHYVIEWIEHNPLQMPLI